MAAHLEVPVFHVPKEVDWQEEYLRLEDEEEIPIMHEALSLFESMVLVMNELTPVKPTTYQPDEFEEFFNKVCEHPLIKQELWYLFMTTGKQLGHWQDAKA